MDGRVSKLAFLGLFLVACGGSVSDHDEAMEAQMDLMEEMVGILEGVTDKASAEKAKPEMEALGKKAQKLAEEIEKLPQPDQAELKRLQEKYQPRMEEFQKKAMEHMMKLMTYPELSEATQKAMSGMK